MPSYIFRHPLPRDFSNDAKPKIDPCSHTTPSNHAAIFHDPRLFMCGSDQRQEASIGRVRRGPSSLQQSGYTENECTRANRMTYFAAPACSRTNSMVSRSLIMPATPSLPPGMQIKSRGRQFAKVCVGTRPSPQSLGTGAVDFATMWVAD